MAAKPVQRDEQGRIVAGSGSLNPGGRPAAARRFSEAIGKQTNDGEKLRKLWWSIIEDKKAPRADKLSASKLLAAYWIGKPPQPVTGEGGEGPAQFERADAELLALFQKAAEKGSAT